MFSHFDQRRTKSKRLLRKLLSVLAVVVPEPPGFSRRIEPRKSRWDGAKGS